MKIRLTVLTENDAPINEKLTEEMIIKTWQLVLDSICLFSGNGDKATVEKAEILEDA